MYLETQAHLQDGEHKKKEVDNTAVYTMNEEIKSLRQQLHQRDMKIRKLQRRLRITTKQRDEKAEILALQKEYVYVIVHDEWIDLFGENS